MRTPIIAGNWKMHKSPGDAVMFVSGLRTALKDWNGVEVVVAPPFVALVPVSEALKGSKIGVAAQNVHWETAGAYTGEVSPPMLKDAGCRYVIIGHSERRTMFGETDQTVNKKVKAALKAGLKPILCIGERLEETEAGKTEEVVTRQIKGALAGVNYSESLVIAYEPVWAIGTGKAATGAQANDTIKLIRSTLAALYGKEPSQSIRIQYGGSVTATNIGEFASQPEIDGALVGGASLKAAEFLSIVEQTANAKRK